LARHRIRPATVTDADGIADIVHGLGGFRAFEHASPEEVRAAVAANVAATLAGGCSTLLVAEDEDGVIVAWAQAHWLHDLFMPGPEGYLTELFVAAAHQGRGIGTDLHDRLVAEARERGAYRMTLLNGTHRASYRRGYYAARGWEEREGMASFVLWLAE
jgi:GNAT superfamily N-acetyltransferase